MKTTTTIASLGLAVGLIASSGQVMAQSNSVRMGLEAVFYHTAADNVQGPFVPPGLTADVGDVQTLYLGYLRRLSSHFDLEFALGIPPKTDTIARGPATVGSVPWNGQVVGTVKWFAPTLLLEYSFCDESARLRPFVGAGINFTHFYARTINANGQAALGGPTYVTLNNSIGPAATLGATYHVTRSWHATLSFSASQIQSTLVANTNGLVRKSQVSFNPQVIVFSIGYAF